MKILEEYTNLLYTIISCIFYFNFHKKKRCLFHKKRDTLNHWNFCIFLAIPRLFFFFCYTHKNNNNYIMKWSICVREGRKFCTYSAGSHIVIKVMQHQTWSVSRWVTVWVCRWCNQLQLEIGNHRAKIVRIFLEITI